MKKASFMALCVFLIALMQTGCTSQVSKDEKAQQAPSTYVSPDIVKATFEPKESAPSSSPLADEANESISQIQELDRSEAPDSIWEWIPSQSRLTDVFHAYGTEDKQLSYLFVSEKDFAEVTASINQHAEETGWLKAEEGTIDANSYVMLFVSPDRKQENPIMLGMDYERDLVAISITTQPVRDTTLKKLEKLN